jgi:hypothetical protein
MSNPTGRRVVVVLELEGISDPRLSEEALESASESPAAVARVRAAVLAALPKRVSRVVAVMPVETAQLMMSGFDAAMSSVGRAPKMPHPDYVPPTRD